MWFLYLLVKYYYIGPVVNTSPDIVIKSNNRIFFSKVFTKKQDFFVFDDKNPSLRPLSTNRGLFTSVPKNVYKNFFILNLQKGLDKYSLLPSVYYPLTPLTCSLFGHKLSDSNRDKVYLRNGSWKFLLNVGDVFFTLISNILLPKLVSR